MLQTILQFDLGIGFCFRFFCQLPAGFFIGPNGPDVSPGRGFETPKSGEPKNGWNLSEKQSKRFLSSKFQLD